MKQKIKIFLAAPRGFCAGVDRAIEIVKKTLNKYGRPVYVRHEIVHNKNVVESLKNLGAIFVEEISDIKDKSRPVIFSAHGVPKQVPEEAKLEKIFYIDATCPLVSKVHRETEQLHPVKRLGEPDEVANAALFLASNEASFITGESMMVDGGISLLIHDEV